MPAIKTGFICGWAGTIVDIPAGWVLCDGNNGTPDLRNRFIIGAGGTYPVGANGGNTQHVHTFTGNGHAHDIPVGTGIEEGAGRFAFTESDPATGTTDNADHLPPYYALAFIMKT